MDNEVIILAQGPVIRLGGPPWIHRLSECGRTPVLERTVLQVMRLGSDRPTVVTWESTRLRCTFLTGSVALVELDEPGNSALKGIARYLELREQQGRRYASTIVLLGDVVYSWACLEAIFRMSRTYGFVGTANLSLNIGELWGVAWSKEFEDRMLSNLRDALLRHPLGDEYHPQQLRRWVSGWKRGDMLDHVAKLTRTGAYIPIDDYTHPGDVVLDPFFGSGTTGQVAEKHERRWIGFDLNPKYAPLAKERTAQRSLPLMKGES